MHPAARLQFERMIDEYTSWRAVPEAERTPAPAWWWGPAIQLRDAAQSMPAEWCAKLGLPDQATFARGSEAFLSAFAGQTALPWPHDFPRKADVPEAKTVRELHPQPSDDSAFQP
ncbi:MAG TPA: hypothetical protein PKA25_13775 [Bradyrhizobium sp.]|nr:hypothetical protein [Bradyrhizobium sp.]